MRLRIIQSGLMSFFLATFMTAWVTFLNLGLSSSFFLSWGKAFIFAWPIAFLIAFTVGPTVAKLAHSINSRFEKK